MRQCSVFFSFLFFSSLIHYQSSYPIKTLVILVLENRSFDHMLGWMMQSINLQINGVTGHECNPVSTSSRLVCFTSDAESVEGDPGHSYEDVLQQVFSNTTVPSMTGFAQQALSVSPKFPKIVMQGFNPNSLPVYSKLVEEFAVFDRWFSSIPGPTQPNRMFAYSATSHGSTGHVTRQLSLGYPQKTIFDSLDENEVDFGIYFQTIPSTLFLRNMRRLKYISKFHQFDLRFKQHAASGKLRPVTVIEPRYFDVPGFPANDDHPSHDVANGQRLVKEVYEALRASPQWNESLLLITYDEHGGFYDHVPTPVANVPNPDGTVGPAPFFFNFDRLGVRVPTLMVSPWIKKRTVVGKAKGPKENSEYEHSSIPATIKKVFNLSSNFLTHRDAWAGTFEGVFTKLTEPRTDCPEKMPEVMPSKGNGNGNGEAKQLTEFQKEMVQLAAVLKGDHLLSTFPEELTRKMNEKDGEEYVQGAVSRFIRASREAIKLGADGSAILDMKTSLTTQLFLRN